VTVNHYLIAGSGLNRVKVGVNAHRLYVISGGKTYALVKQVVNIYSSVFLRLQAILLSKLFSRMDSNGVQRTSLGPVCQEIRRLSRHFKALNGYNRFLNANPANVRATRTLPKALFQNARRLAQVSWLS
jgi:hypothetical protein